MHKKFIFVFLSITLVGIFYLFGLAPNCLAYTGTQIVINKGTNQLGYWKDGNLIKIFPVATGRQLSYTPEGNFSIVIKLVNPYYGKLNIPGGSPKNPLGCCWLGLSIGGGGVYGIHGTNNPASIGTYASAGCIRMHNQDATWLYDNTPLGTPVKIIRTSTAFQIKPDPQPVTIAVNGVNKTLDCPAGISSQDGSPLLPLRPLFNELGFNISWDKITSTIKITKNDDHILINLLTKQVITEEQKSYICKDLKVLNGVSYASWSLWQNIMSSSMVVSWDSQQRLIELKYKQEK